MPLKHYGITKQTLKLAEEQGELIQVLSKKVFDNKFDPDNELLIEEFADVEILLAQMKAFYKVDQSAIEAIKTYKINRTQERIEKEKLDKELTIEMARCLF